MNCVVYGGGGFIGSAVVDRLLHDRHFVRVVERERVLPFREFTSDERAEWVIGDFLNAQQVDQALEGVDTVIHLVSSTLPKESNENPIYDVQSNLVPTLQLLEAMRAHKIRRIVFISSGGTIYGDPAYLPIDEAHPTNPLVSYGITKLAIEKYLQLAEKLYGIKAVILRVANPFGSRQRLETAQGAVTAFIHRALRREPVEIWGDGLVTRDYVYIDDVAEAFARAATYDGTKSVFNIGSGIGTSLNDLVMTIEGVIGRPVERRFLPARPFDIRVSVLSNALAREELGWTPRISLREGVARTVGWVGRTLEG